jgi:hypothetical protein
MAPYRDNSSLKQNNYTFNESTVVCIYWSRNMFTEPLPSTTNRSIHCFTMKRGIHWTGPLVHKERGDKWTDLLPHIERRDKRTGPLPYNERRDKQTGPLPYNERRDKRTGPLPYNERRNKWTDPLPYNERKDKWTDLLPHIESRDKWTSPLPHNDIQTHKLMWGTYRVHHSDGFSSHDIHTKFHKDWWVGAEEKILTLIGT